jgi:hypothetical protein
MVQQDKQKRIFESPLIEDDFTKHRLGGTPYPWLGHHFRLRRKTRHAWWSAPKAMFREVVFNERRFEDGLAPVEGFNYIWFQSESSTPASFFIFSKLQRRKRSM